MSTALPPATYILPLRWMSDDGLDELVEYLWELSSYLSVIVVDGSPPELFAVHAAQFPREVRHVAPEVPVEGANGPEGGPVNGKVLGVLTGLRHATTELLVLADDDVRYDPASLERLLELLQDADVVRPQNYFRPLPWHARWDTSRTLLNRAFGADYPGTFGVRRSVLLAAGGYDAAVLFENLEMLRTIRAAGGRERVAQDLFVRRLPPRSPHFLRQRVRQAYDDFAQPLRLGVELLFLPVLVLAAFKAASGRFLPLAGLLGALCLSAETGRRRHKGRQVFPVTSALWTPLWFLERAVCIWAALALRLSGGVPYAGARLKVAAHSEAQLRKRHRTP